jgi:peptide/nickel transport system substrate-binding protein
MTNPVTPYVDYLLPNFKTMTNPLVRQALAVATDKTGYITAYGGPAMSVPSNSITQKSVAGFKDFPNPFGAPDGGDPAKAKALLQQAGVHIPYPIHYTYNGGTPTSDAQASALKASWEKAGFKVTLESLSDTYYDVIQNPHNAAKYDVVWASWGADWPNASTVVRHCSTAG